MNKAAEQLVSPRILIVEDERITAMDLRLSLVDLGYEVAGMAYTAAAALRLAGECKPDLVLMDIRLNGETSGIHAADEIRHHWHIPVVYTTAYTNTETIERAKATAPFGFLVKPFRTRDLNVTIVMALQQHRISQEILKSRARLETILTSIRDSVIATDSRGVVEFMNAGAEQLTGWSKQEAIGQPIEAIYKLRDAEGRPVHQCLVRRALATHQSTGKHRFLLTRKSGEEIPIEETAAPILGAGNDIDGAVTVAFDITERVLREMREAREQERLHEQAMATDEALSHAQNELRRLANRLVTAQDDERRRLGRELHDDASQRLAFLHMEAESLKRYPVTPEVRVGLQRISDQTGVLSSYLRELSHHLHPSVVEDLGIGPALQSLVDDYSRRGLKVSLEAEEITQPASVNVETSLYRIAQEALHNATKYARNAECHVRLVEDEKELHLIVEDTGPGFDVDQVREKGGLGLTSMQERAQLVGGSCQLDSKPGAGTRVFVRVPREPLKLD